MKKFLLKILIFALYALAVSVIIPFSLDPFNVLHWEHIRVNGVEPNKNYIKMKYILANPGKFDSFMFGSSRVGFIHTHKIIGEKCYNMTYSSGLPGWHLLNIKTFLDNGIRPKKIYIGLDWYSYPVSRSYNNQVHDPIRCPYEYLANDTQHFIKLYLDTSAAVKSLFFKFQSLHGVEIINTETFYEYGYGFGNGFSLDFDWKNPPSFVGGEFDIDLALGFIKETYDICRKNGIELVLFTHPMYYKSCLSPSLQLLFFS